MLMNDQAKFFSQVIKSIGEKNSGKKYVGSIEFER